MMVQDVDASVVLQESSFARDSSFVSEGGLDTFVPQLFLSSGFLDLCVYFVGRGHDERPEMRGLKNDDVSVVVLSLVVIIAAGQ